MRAQRLITFDGKTMNVGQWASHLGINPVTLSARLGRYNMPLEVALQSTCLQRQYNGGWYKQTGLIRDHRAIAEKALGKPLPQGAVVHHVDEDKSNNDPSNLVICPDHAYHALIHARMKAHAACGQYHYRKCVYCKEWDDPDNMKLTKNRSVHHAKCHAEYHANLRRKTK